MRVYVLIREDQNNHGFVDVSIDGIYLTQKDAEEVESDERDLACREGLKVEELDQHGASWQVSWKIEEHEVF